VRKEALMPPPKRARKFENVQIEFVNEEYFDTQAATVILRDDGMVIEIEADDDDYSDYTIVGHPVKHYFQGVNSARDMNKVLARWVKLGPLYVGTWLESGQQFFFSFEIRQE
jgi:hypothetical protein